MGYSTILVGVFIDRVLKVLKEPLTCPTKNALDIDTCWLEVHNDNACLIYLVQKEYKIKITIFTCLGFLLLIMEYQVVQALANSVSNNNDFLQQYTLHILALASKQTAHTTHSCPTLFQILHTLFRHRELTIYYHTCHAVNAKTDVSVITPLNLGFTENEQFLIWDGFDLLHAFNHTNAFCEYLLANIAHISLTLAKDC